MSQSKPAAKSESAVAGVVRIPEPVKLSAIHIVDGFNARTTFAEKPIASLAESMAAVGQLEDIILSPRYVTRLEEGAPSPVRDGWNLVAGARRLRAAQSLGWRSLRASEVPESVASDVMGAENADRVDLPHADRVRYIVAQLAAKTADVPTLARRFRLSVGSVRNDNLIGTKLEPSVFEEWSRFPHAAGIALRLYARPQAEQVEMFAEWKAAREADEIATKARGGKRARAKRGAKGKGKGADADATRRPIGEVRAAVAAMAEATKAAKGLGTREALDKEVAAFVAGAEWCLAFLFSDGPSAPRDVTAELRRVAKAAAPDPRQLAIPGTSKKGRAK